MTQFKRPKTAQEAVLVEIREQLLNGRLQPGDAIRPDVIGEQLGVSAVPVREALRILEGEGQVRYRPHRGYLVTELTADDLMEMYRIRELLEAEAVREAISNLQEDDIQTMRSAIEDMELARDDVVKIRAANRRFHFALLDAAQMPHLSRMINWLWDASEPCHYRSANFMHEENLERVAREHQQILDAVIAGDASKIIDELTKHQRHAFEVVREELKVEQSKAS